MACIEELKRIIERRDGENEKLQNDLAVTRKWIDEKMAQRMLLHDQMVINHRRMLNECKAYKEDLKRANLVNRRYKLIARSLTSKVEELTGNKIENEPDNRYADAVIEVRICRDRGVYNS